MKYVDAHCHINSYNPDTGIRIVVTNAAKIDNWANVINCADALNVYGAIGVHPWHINNLPEKWFDAMAKNLEQNPRIMVGEIGLDKNAPDIDAQIDIFVAQMLLAHKFNRVAHIHCVGAWDKIVYILNQIHNTMPPALIFHGFDGKMANPNTLCDKYNAYFSFGPAICDESRQRIKDALKTIPISRILSESDSDNPHNVISVVDSMANILDMPVADLTEIIYNNINRLVQNG